MTGAFLQLFFFQSLWSPYFRSIINRCKTSSFAKIQLKEYFNLHEKRNSLAVVDVKTPPGWPKGSHGKTPLRLPVVSGGNRDAGYPSPLYNSLVKQNNRKEKAILCLSF